VARTPHTNIRIYDMQYRIVNVDSISFLEERIAQHISEGWTPQGGVCVITEDGARRYIQAMIRKK